jgi:hypothetical protein
MKNLKTISAILFMMSFFISCKKESVEPEPTGSLRIVVNRVFQGEVYELYPNDISPFFNQILPLRSGMIPVTTTPFATITLQDLNEGNYVLRIGQTGYSVQVTRGKVRDFSF